MRINHNISALITQGSVFRANRSMAKSIEKLSTGLRINSAADDAAGLGVSENLRTQVRGLQQALKNTQDTIAMLNIADGALNEQAEILQRMRELVIQAKNDTYTDTERGYMYQEFSALMSELDRINAVTNYNGMNLFAAPQSSGHVSRGLYDDDYQNGIHEANYETAHSSNNQQDIWTDPGKSIFGDSDMSSANYFNMMIGANYQQEDIQAYKTLINHGAGNQRVSAYADRGAANMLTVQLGQMDSHALLTPDPYGYEDPGWGPDGMYMWNAHKVWDAFSVWTDPTWASGDSEDNFYDWYSPDIEGEMGDYTAGNKLNYLLSIIDGKPERISSDASSAANFFDPTAGGPYRTAGVTGLERVNRMRSYIGATINRLEHAISNSMNQMTNQQAAESYIRDADFASETTTFTRSSILVRSATAMLAQANMVPQAVLQLIR